MQYLQFKIFERFRDRLKHGLSTREGGVSSGYLASLNLSLKADEMEDSANVVENYRRFCEAVGVDVAKLALGYQVHEDKIVEIREDGVAGMNFGLDNAVLGADGFITNVVGVPLMVRFADCQGVLMFDPVARVIAAVHSGWRGNVKNIIGVALRKMTGNFGCKAENILVGVSASLGPCCAEFSDPYSEWPEVFHKHIDSQKRVDLWACSFDQIQAEGVLPENIEISKRCTVCENDVFFSYRGGKKKTGHMGAVIQLF